MKKSRIATIVSISVALVLISSVTYAAVKKKEGKPVFHVPETISEEEALTAELLAATEESHGLRLPETPVKDVAEDRPEKKDDNLEG